MLEILASKEVDIYISVVTSLFGAICGVLLDRATKRPLASASSDAPAASVSLQQVVVRISAESNISNDGNQRDFFFATLLVTSGIAYLFFRHEVLWIGLLVVLFIFGAWAGLVAHSLCRGFFGGRRWLLYLLVMLLFALAAVRVAGLAETPMFAPTKLIYAQEIVNRWGIASLRQYFTVLDLGWFCSHLFGVCLFFAASWRACFSMFNYAVIGTRLSNGTIHRELGGKLASAYGRPWRNSFGLLGLMVAANYLVSGQLFMWLVHEMPIQVNYLMQIVLHGRDGG